MLRKHLFSAPPDQQFRKRSEEIFRIEALSDAVFAFSVSILVASLEAPRSFAELKEILMGVVPFFATVFVVFVFWYQQYKYFRHYAINDFRSILINLGYLALILFYVYPLKFLFSVLLASFTGMELFPKAGEEHVSVLTQAEFPQLIIVFSLGYMLLWCLLALMYKRALNRKAELALTDFEKEFTIKEYHGALWNGAVGGIAILFALLKLEWMAGICYLFIPFILKWNEGSFRKRTKAKVKPVKVD